MKKNILILGATSAIAEQAARLWAMQGNTLYLMARDAARLERVGSDLSIRGAQRVYDKCLDLSEPLDHAAVLREVVETMGSLDIVLIAYGVLGVQSVNEQNVDASLHIMQTNLMSVVAWLTVIAHVYEQQAHGTIAVIGSVAGLKGRAANYVYGASKGGLLIFLQGLRQRLAKKKVHVLTVLPGFVDSPMTASFQKNALWEKPERVARDIVQAIEKKKDILYTPWYWRFIMMVVQSIPEWLYKRIQIQ